MYHFYPCYSEQVERKISINTVEATDKPSGIRLVEVLQVAYCLDMLLVMETAFSC